MMHQFLPRVALRGHAIALRTTCPQRIQPISSRLLSSATTQAAAPAQAAARPSRTHSQPPVPPPSKSPAELATLPYIVRRTPSAQLPLYKRTMSGGTRHVVLIKKVDGNRRKLLDDMVAALQIPKGEIRINPTTQHIELKGVHFDKTRAWLLEQGF
ncbi:mitochondrial large ribosomal subunit L49 [Purpureocillium takamizusanense]|uniref:Large ribosomal subunit protein mL49 n=1 Tax=Purpureocillium takamizusanense TaxID=2060973 RepID=A0A9Q8QDX9_9HYPO|nr:mitochondrial large ribosomal subunit L49 [Purpureocillium takamizusanense]UNI17487.1 mitochondrial large ribosomal subunit L49 [Purpureocillium takamizusanense]